MTENSLKNTSARHTISGHSTMLKYYAEIERMVFAAETYCTDAHDIRVEECTGCIDKCPFNNKDTMTCTLKTIRNLIGEP